MKAKVKTVKVPEQNLQLAEDGANLENYYAIKYGGRVAIDMVNVVKWYSYRVMFVSCIIFIITLPQICVAKPLTKVTLSSDGTSTGLPDLFTGTFSYSIPIEVPVGRKGMDPGLALQYRSGAPNGRVGVGWDFDLGSIQRAFNSSNKVDYTQNKFLFVKSGNASSLTYSNATTYRETIEGSFRNIQQLVATSDGKPYWLVTEKNGMRYFFGQSAQSRQDDPGNNTKIYKWCLDRIEDTNGNYVSCYYYKNQGQIYLDRIEYTGFKNNGMLPTNSINVYWEARQDTMPDTTTFGFSVTTAYRLSAIDIINKPTANSIKRIRAYKLTYDANPSTNGSQYSVTGQSLLYSVQQFDKNCQIATKADINSSGVITGGSSLPAKTMLYDQVSTSQSVDYLTSFTNGIGGTTSITYSTESLVGTTLPAINVSTVTGSDGNGNLSTTYYHYTGGFFYATESDYRGFNKVEVRGPVSDGKQTRTETFFHQGNDTDVDANKSDVATGYTKGKPYCSTVYAVSGVTTGNESTVTKQKVSETTTIYAQPASTQSASYFTPPMQVDSYICDAGGSCKQSRTIYGYDGYGNVNYEEHQGDIYDATDNLTITRTYSENQNLWIVGLPTSEDTYQGIGAFNKISGKKYFYDETNSSCAGPFYKQVPNFGNLARVEYWQDTNALQIEQRVGYDNFGNVVCYRDANSINSSNGKITTITYDSSNTYPVTTTNPLGHVSRIQYYGVNEQTPTNLGLYGQQKSITDPNDATVTKEYDSFGRQIKETQPDGTFTTRTYNNLGAATSQNIRSQTSDGIWTEKYFDGLGRGYLNKSIAAESKTIESKTSYDARGMATTSSSQYFSLGTPNYVLSSYDEIGRVKKTWLQSLESIRTSTCYSVDAKVTIDPNNHRRREVYNTAGHLIKAQEYQGVYSSCSPEEGSPYATTLYEYDVLGHLLKVSDALSNQTEMHYDALGRKRYMKDPDMGVWTYIYDENGNLIIQSDAKIQSISFTYDELNRLKTKTFGGTIVQTNYYDEATSTNSVGRLSRSTDTTGQTVYNYDKMGRVTSTIKTIDGISYKLTYGYLNGRLDSITYPDNEKIHYTYDAGYLKGPDGYINYSNFDAQGRPQNAAYGTGGASSLYSYYPYTQRLHTITVASSTQGVLIDNIYSFDNKGNVNNVTDNLGKILPTTVPSEVYTIDEARAHAVGSTDSGRIFLYDANGNVTSDGSRTISYNFENMPTQVNTTSITYDGNSTRVKKVSPLGTTVYIGKLYECTNGVCTKYIYAGNSMVASKSGSQILFYHPDHQGSTSVVTDALGNKVGDSAYLPFGATRQESGLTSVKYKYTGQEQDKETGLYNYNARLYDPDMGRFMTPDSIVPDPRNPQSLNRYSYADNNPINFTDPTGHCKGVWKCIAAGAEVVVGIVAIAASPLCGPGMGACAVAGATLTGYGVTQLGGDSQGTAETTVATFGGGGSSSNSSGGGSSSNNNSSSNPGTASNGVLIGNTGINYVGPGSGAWNSGNYGGYNYGYPSMSLGYGDLGAPSSFTLANAVRSASTEGFNAGQVATQRAWAATSGIATNGPPVAQATLALAAYFTVGPFAGPLATTYVLTNPMGALDFASAQFPGPATPTAPGGYGAGFNWITDKLGFPVIK